MKYTKDKYVWGLLRLFLGWIFFWAFIDKLFGLGFNTAADKSWLAGASPTLGFLKFATKGPLAGLYQAMAGSVVVDWLFMLGLGLIGLARLLGVGVKIAGYSGIALMALMYTAASIWPEHNPFLDEHLVYAAILLGLVFVDAGKYWGLGEWWGNTKLVQKYSVLK